ncbi:MAG: hypothetical protein EOP24_42375 [Hyphomicrobiales bacterium]|nr:MAG: hypothetical protein EOP24_42375 [Hyphomicrobiales bacterium]
MPKFDISMNVKEHDRLLAVLENPRHRRIVENYRRHALLEVMGYWEQIFEPEMTVEVPIYKFNYMGINDTIVGDDVRKFYKEMAESGRSAIVVTDETIVVGDEGFGTKAYHTQFFTGSVIRELGFEADDPDAWYSFKQLIISFWPYDENGRMIGEWGSSVGQPEIEKVDESDVVSVQDARAALEPQLRPLSEKVPADA